MSSILDQQLDKIKEYSEAKLIEKLNHRIYSLDLPMNYLSTLSTNKILYIHVRLHNALSYKKPFAPIEDIKIVHDRVSSLMQNHVKSDKLDEN